MSGSEIKEGSFNTCTGTCKISTCDMYAHIHYPTCIYTYNPYSERYMSVPDVTITQL